MNSSRVERLLVTVLTYPNPSTRYEETVCTAAITDDGRWVRLYPVPLRQLTPERRLHKWQWLDVETHPVRGNDVRPESRRPNLDTHQVVRRLDATDDREERRRLIDLLTHKTMTQWKQGYEADKTSLGVVRPAEVLDIEVKPDPAPWPTHKQNVLDQFDLFGNAPRKLAKVPYHFRYVFRCEDRREPHRLTITDWELGVLFLRMRDEHGEENAVLKVKQKFLDQMCAPDKDTRFFIGTMWPRNQWLCIGTFWAPLPRAAKPDLQSLLPFE